MAKKKLITSQSRPLVVDTQYAALSTNFYIQSQSDQVLEQWYDEKTNAWNPNRASAEPLVLIPVLSIDDPDGILPSQAAAFKSVVWREIREYNGTSTDYGDVTNITDTVVIGGQSVRVYTQATDGTLTVRRNVPVGWSYRLRCSAVYTDTRTGADMSFQSEIALLTSKTADPPYSLVLTTERNAEYHPLLNAVSAQGQVVVENISFGAKLFQGDTEVTGAKCFWYLTDKDHPNGILVGDVVTVDGTEMPFVGYVSGQGTSTLTVNPDYCNGVTLMLCASALSTATQPDLDVREYFSLTTVYDKVSGETVSHSGMRLSAGKQEMTFRQLMKVKDQNMPDAIYREYILTNWKHKKASSNTVTDDGYGETVTLGREDLKAPSGDSTLVYAEFSPLSGYMPLTTDDGKFIVAYENGPIIVGRVTEVEDDSSNNS